MYRRIIRLAIRIFYILRVLVNSLWAIPAVIVIRLLKPILHIQICQINSERIGHFTADIAEHIARSNFKISHVLKVYYFHEIANRQWETMARRSDLITVGSWVQYLDKWNQLMPGGDAHVLKTSLTGSRDTGGLLSRFDTSIPFLPTENAEAEKWLRSKGWTKGEPIVVILVRDSEYLKEIKPHINWDYHNYRDSDVITYLTAMEWLASQNVWVIRMGKSMSTRVVSDKNRIIDYAFDSKKSDLLDIWLFANCTGVISTGSGPDILAAIYRKPILFVNYIPLVDVWSWANSITEFKHLKWIKNGKKLNLNEYLNNNIVHGFQYQDKGIEIVDQSAREILLAVQNFWKNINGNTESSILEEKFWLQVTASPNFQERNGWIHPNCRIGTGWLAAQDSDFFA